MSVMLDLGQKYLVCGSIKGDLHMVKTSCLFSEQDFVTEKIAKDKMCLAKSYAAHVSFVNQCETNPRNEEYLFTTGVTDECIIKWHFSQEEQMWDFDNLEYP